MRGRLHATRDLIGQVAIADFCWPITEIQIRHVMVVLQRMADAGLIETLHRCRQKLAHILERAIVGA